MKKIILLELCFLFLATTFKSDKMTGWIQQTIPRPDLPVRDLQFLDSLTGFIVQSRFNPDTSFISKTIDGGNNWITSQLDNIVMTSLKFIDKNTGYCAGGQGTTPFPGIVKKTTDKGENWFTVSLVSDHIYLEDIEFINKDTGWVCSTDIIAGGLWRTTDGGISWQKQLNETYKPSKIFFVNENTGWVIGNADVNLYKTTNCGLNWFQQYNFGNISMKDVFFISQDTGWIVKSIGTGQNSIVQTTNGGNNWIGVNSPIVSTSAKLFFINNVRGWAGDAFNRIVTTMNGYDWGTQSSPIYSNYNVNFTDSSKGWAGASGLVHTTDGGGAIVSVNNENTLTPEDYILEQNYPNPFNQSSIIKYKCSISGMISIAVYDLTGKEIAVLVKGYKQPGNFTVKFNSGELPAGVYFCRLYADNKPVSVIKIVIVK